MKNKDDDQRSWMFQHCDACTQGDRCVTPLGVLVGENGRCWTGKEDGRVFCPYNPVSAVRYKMMKILQRRSRELEDTDQ